MRRAIREIQPRYVVGENVAGLISWNGGMVFDEVQAELEDEGYQVWAFILPACGVNAPHRRDRIWFIAHSNRNGFDSTIRTESNIQKQQNTIEPGDRGAGKVNGLNDEWDASNTLCKGLQRRESERNGTNREGEDYTENGIWWEDKRFGRRGWEKFPVEPPICRRNDGVSTELDFDTVFEGIKKPSKRATAFGRWRNESIKAYGNAIVPQVAYEIFKAIEQTEIALTLPGGKFEV